MIRPLTSLRFFAAFAVFLSHLGFLAAVPSARTAWERVFYEGYAGVTFFFVLSGFILTYTYHGKLRRFDAATLAPYALSRVGRIVPVHLLTLVLSLPLMLLLVVGGGGELPAHGPTGITQEVTPIFAAVTGLCNLFLVQAFVPIQNVNFSFNGPSWSLGNELFFYALLPIALIAVARSRIKPSPRLAVGVAACIWLLMLAAAAAYRGLPIEHWFLYVNPVFRAGDFAIGGLLGYAFVHRSPVRDPRRAAWTLAELAALGFLAALVWYMPHVPQAYRYGTYYLPAMCAVIVAFAHSSGVVSTVLSLRAFVWLGEISFSFYMFHQLVIRYGLEMAGSQPAHPYVFAIGCAIAAIAVSALCFRTFETPMRLRIRNFHGANPKPPVDTPDLPPSALSTAVSKAR